VNDYAGRLIRVRKLEPPKKKTAQLTVVANVGSTNWAWANTNKSEGWAPASKFPDADPYDVVTSGDRQWVVDNGTNTVEGNGTTGRNVFGLGAGFGFAMNSNTDVEVSGLFQNRSFKGSNFNTPDNAEDDGGSTYQIAARAMKKSGSNLVLIPAIKLYSFDRSAVDNAAVATEEKLTGWSIGLAGNWTLGSDDLFILGGNFVGNKFEQTVGANPTQTVNETFYPNMFMALETHTNSWLTLRFGAQNAVMFSAKQEVGPNSQTIKQHVFSFNTGATVKAGSLTFDATLTPQFFNNPVSATFNNGLGATPFGRVSATYSF